jgi:DNA primase
MIEEGGHHMKTFFEKLGKVPNEHGLYQCPLHLSMEHTVLIQDENFVCFECNASGDVEQLKQLLARNSTTTMQYDDKQKRILFLNKIATEYFQNSLAKSNVAKNYLASRSLDEATIQKFCIGFANADWTATKQYLLEKGFTEDEMVEAGVIFLSKKNGKTYDFYRNRIMFPIRDAWGNVVGFSGRTIVDDDRKYINTSENCVFHKRSGFFNLNHFDSSYSHVIICEGQMDVIAFSRGGIPNAVASLGTALTMAHAKIIAAIAKDVYLCFDGDNAGQSALEKAKLLFAQLGISTKKVSTLQPCKDPDEVYQKFGSDGLRKMLKNAK